MLLIDTTEPNVQRISKSFSKFLILDCSSLWVLVMSIPSYCVIVQISLTLTTNDCTGKINALKIQHQCNDIFSLQGINGAKSAPCKKKMLCALK